jgi:hypothetical protein
MRPEPQKIRLGDKEWTIRPLTLKQVQNIELIIYNNAKSNAGNVKAAIEVISAGLFRDYPDDCQTLYDVEATATEISIAMAAILRLGGFTEATPGEARATGTNSGEDSTVA